VLLAQAEGWIGDKLKVAYEDDFKNVGDLLDKMKKLQKHQAFEAEILANTDRINKIKEVRVKVHYILSIVWSRVREQINNHNNNLFYKAHISINNNSQQVLTLCFTQFLSLIFDFVLSWFSAFF
jgi:hypothetical protein